MSAVLSETLDLFVDGLTRTALRDHPAQVKAALRLLDKHRLWKPRGKDALQASRAVQQAVIQLIYYMFGDAVNEPRFFRRWDRICGAECARFVTAFALQKHRRVKQFWTYSRHGLARPIPD